MRVSIFAASTVEIGIAERSVIGRHTSHQVAERRHDPAILQQGRSPIERPTVARTTSGRHSQFGRPRRRSASTNGVDLWVPALPPLYSMTIGPDCFSAGEPTWDLGAGGEDGDASSRYPDPRASIREDHLPVFVRGAGWHLDLASAIECHSKSPV